MNAPIHKTGTEQTTLYVYAVKYYDLRSLNFTVLKRAERNASISVQNLERFSQAKEKCRKLMKPDKNGAKPSTPLIHLEMES